MKFFPKLIALGTAVAILAACHLPVSTGSGADGQERYTQAVKSWQGANIEDLRSAWPRSRFKEQTTASDGSPMYVFIWTEETYREAEQYFDHAHNEWVDKTPAGTELLICETRFITDSQGLITDVRPGSYQCGQMPPPSPRPRA